MNYVWKVSSIRKRKIILIYEHSESPSAFKLASTKLGLIAIVKLIWRSIYTDLFALLRFDICLRLEFINVNHFHVSDRQLNLAFPGCQYLDKNGISLSNPKTRKRIYFNSIRPNANYVCKLKVSCLKLAKVITCTL